MSIKKYRIIKGCGLGEIVYRFNGYDYGCSSDDTRLLGKEHISVTHDPNGDIPFFTIERDSLQEI